MNYFCHSSAIIDKDVLIGEGSKIWHFSHIMSNSILGRNCILGQNVFVGKNVQIGDNVKIQNNVSVYEGVICEKDVFLGPSVVFTNVINPRSFVNRRKEFKKTLVKKGASIGANATVLCGNKIGAYAMIGAGAVVTKDIQDYALVVGNPVKQIGWVSQFGNKLIFNEEGLGVCSETGTKYILKDNQVKIYQK